MRAERSASGNGRVYRIAYTVSDGTASCSGMPVVLAIGLCAILVLRRRSEPSND